MNPKPFVSVEQERLTGEQLVRRHIEWSWNRGKERLLAHCHTRDFFYFNSLIGRKTDFQGFSQTIQLVRHYMPDLEVLTDDIIVDHNKLATTSTFYGTLKKPLPGVEPSDRVITLSAISVWYLQSGRIRSLTTLFNMEELLEQTGLTTLKSQLAPVLSAVS
ncbi:ester cyclase [Kistimonas asteriae]|uniref:ester cyclase n=1 Tax=Kistimonas asteriae TaxID=517724 RepID=UPI001BAB41D1|nr:ester cyclase [Kistimonas asteriae]